MTSITRIKIKVTLGAKQDTIIGWHGDVLKARINAKSDKGKTNTELKKLIADILGVHAKNIRVTMRLASKNKHISIDCLSEPEVKSKINHHAANNKKVVN